MMVMMGRDGRCLFGRRGSWGSAFEVLERGDSNSRRGSSFGRVVVMMVVTIKKLVKRITTKELKKNKSETYW